jgi:hypothetical protein
MTEKNDEKTKIEKEWKCCGFDCKVIFVRGSHRCGYVAVPKNHVAYDKSYDDMPIVVHGGLTYGSNRLMGKTYKNKFWFGFDCAHAGDKILGLPGFSNDEHFWSLKEVVAETEKMAKQFKGMTMKKILKHNDLNHNKNIRVW